MDPTTTGGVLSQGAGVLFGLGLPGVCIAALGVWVYLQNRRVNELTDKFIELVTASTLAQANATAANNRLADMLSVKRDNGQ